MGFRAQGLGNCSEGGFLFYRPVGMYRDFCVIRLGLGI